MLWSALGFRCRCVYSSCSCFLLASADELQVDVFLIVSSSLNRDLGFLRKGCWGFALDSKPCKGEPTKPHQDILHLVVQRIVGDGLASRSPIHSRCQKFGHSSQTPTWPGLVRLRQSRPPRRSFDDGCMPSEPVPPVDFDACQGGQNACEGVLMSLLVISRRTAVGSSYCISDVGV